MRLKPALLIAAAVAACSPAVPDSGAPAGAGVGGDYTAYRSLNEPVLTTPAPATGVEPSALPTGTAGGGEPAATAGTTIATTPTATVPTGTAPTGGTATPAGTGTGTRPVAIAGIGSDDPGTGATPSDGGAAGPGIVSYALSTSNTVGQKIYGRSVFASAGRAARNCARYASSDEAQEAFLAEGGPERDRLNLDPDGDGFACDWNPGPFRQLAAANRR